MPSDPGGGVAAAIAGLFGLGHFVPYGPVLTPAERTAFSVDAPSGVTYTSRRAVPCPVLPVVVFGVPYDLDLVLVSTHPEWDMHEYARLSTPDGPVWLCKDARSETLEQSIVADIDGIEHWLPEVPVPRKRWPVKVEDRSTPGWLDLSLAYENMDGEAVELDFRGPAPSKLEGRRNTSTMGHSRGSVMAVLDMSHKALARHAELRIDGQVVPLKRIAGLVPFRLALLQTQAGLAIGSWTQTEMSATGFVTEHPSGTEQRWMLHRLGDRIEATQTSRLRTLRFRFREHEGALELERASVEHWDRGTPACVVQFSPPLPDAGRAFDGLFVGRFVIDVNGQASHAAGRVEAVHEDGTTTLRLLPESPSWVTDRAMEARVTPGAQVVAEVVRVER